MWSLLLTGNWISLCIYALLLVMSVLSWAIIIAKAIRLRAVEGENAQFYQAFLRGQPLGEIHQASQKFAAAPLARMFEASYREIGLYRGQMEKPGGVAVPRERIIAAVGRALERVFNHQQELLEQRLPFLATVSGSAPFIGLFGTVLGIIDAFRNIGSTGVTSLAVVAPGISEALVATAGGLLAAIPALVAYNYYRNRIRDITSQMKNFALELINRFDRIL